jgi:hypothetical protein
MTTIIDDSYTRIIVRAGNVYYRHAEHGGNTQDALCADFSVTCDAGLAAMMRDAYETSRPTQNWEYARLCAEVRPFSSQMIVERLIREGKRRVALAKLTPEERDLLGIRE